VGPGDLESLADDVLVGAFDLTWADDLDTFPLEAGIVGGVKVGLMLQEVEGFVGHPSLRSAKLRLFHPG